MKRIIASIVVAVSILVNCIPVMAGNVETSVSDMKVGCHVMPTRMVETDSSKLSDVSKKVVSTVAPVVAGGLVGVVISDYARTNPVVRDIDDGIDRAVDSATDKALEAVIDASDHISEAARKKLIKRHCTEILESIDHDCHINEQMFY